MRVLVISNTPWADSNSFGNSFSNIFKGIKNIEFANIYCKSGISDNSLSMRCFQITEKSLIRNLVDRKYPSGKEVQKLSVENGDSKGKAETKAIVGYELLSGMRWQVIFWMRDLIWKIGQWKSEQLRDFLDGFQPDIMFQPVYYSNYINEIVMFCKDYLNIPMLGYISDDNYTLRQFNLSPLYWIDRLHKRKKVKRVIQQCVILYVISEIQKEEYEQIFDLPCKILTKCSDFDEKLEYKIDKCAHDEIILNYAGGIGGNRWKSLAMISRAVSRLLEEGFSLQFDIYTSTNLTYKMKRCFQKKGTILHQAVSYQEIYTIQNQADILVHVEGLDKKNRYAVHQSFSTKLVDYFKLGKCIFAIGTEDMAAIQHLKKNHAAVIAENESVVYDRLKELVENLSLVATYAQAAYECGKNHHNRLDMQKMLIEDLTKICKKNCSISN